MAQKQRGSGHVPVVANAIGQSRAEARATGTDTQISTTQKQEWKDTEMKETREQASARIGREMFEGTNEINPEGSLREVFGAAAPEAPHKKHSFDDLTKNDWYEVQGKLIELQRQRDELLADYELLKSDNAKCFQAFCNAEAQLTELLAASKAVMAEPLRGNWEIWERFETAIKHAEGK
jgi:hypothetical protein